MKKILKIGIIVLIFICTFLLVKVPNAKASIDYNQLATDELIVFQVTSTSVYIVGTDIMPVEVLFNNIDFDGYADECTTDDIVIGTRGQFHGATNSYTVYYIPDLTNIPEQSQDYIIFPDNIFEGLEMVLISFDVGEQDVVEMLYFYCDYYDGIYKVLPQDYITNFYEIGSIARVEKNMFNNLNLRQYKTFNLSYNEGLQDGLLSTQQEIYTKGYNKGYNFGYIEGELKGYAEKVDEEWDKGYDKGYDDAMTSVSTNGEYQTGYNIGFNDGSNQKNLTNVENFYKGIEKWLVPAIITILVLGGFIAYRNKSRESI